MAVEKTISKEELNKWIDQHTIYFLKKDGEIVYVGQTIYFPYRLKAHLAGKNFDEVVYSEVEGTNYDIDLIESKLIIKYKPVYNTNMPINPEKLGFIKESRLPKGMPEHIKERSFFMLMRGVNYYHSKLIWEGE